jgi:N6-adenosine-specific RNA methylase IME4
MLREGAVKYRTIVADPPWPMPWTAGANRKNGRGEIHPNWKRELGYPTMTVDEIAALPVADLAEAEAHLYLWIPDRWLIDGDGGRLARSWGFDPLRCIIWAKKGYGLGKFPRPAHEAVIVCRRGALPFQLDTYPSVQHWKRPYGPPRFGGRGIGSGRVHSAKPDGFLDDVEQASPGPYLELFARRQRLGWDTWGDEALEHVQMDEA